MSDPISLALAIPSHNDHTGLARLLQQAAEMELFEQVIVVDDGSDPRVEVDPEALPFTVTHLRHDTAQGPGVARNRALTEVTTSHVLFFDSDDLLGAELLPLWQDLQGQDFDFCLFRHNDSRNGAEGGQMAQDEALWQAADAIYPAPTAVQPEAIPLLAQTANYPWNKIYSCAFLRQNTLRCSDIMLHEDMELHWMGFLKASRVLASSRICATHFVTPEGSRLTNQRSIARLQAFLPMQLIYRNLRDRLGPDHALTLAYLEFLDGLWHWIGQMTDPAHQELLQIQKRNLLRHCLDLDQQGALLTHNPALAQRLTDHRLATPRLQPQPACLKVYLSGRHAKRTPLSYTALKPLFEDRIALVATPQDADLMLFAHNMDVQEAEAAVIEVWRKDQRPLVLLSEEPFWDTIWGGEPLQSQIITDTNYGAVPLRQISHQTSDIFHFDTIPYYLLTNHRFANAYQYRFQRNAARSAADWQADFANRPATVSFMFERRPEPYHAVSWPEEDLIGLCSWRTELAEACQFEGVERLGRSWDGRPSRLTMNGDWHQDKLTQLDTHARMIGALENTHQPHYITEKIFDAFACGSLPVYYASPRHRIYDFDLPPDSWVNLYGLTPQAAADRLSNQIWDAAFFDAYREAQVKLSEIFTDQSLWRNERMRLHNTLLSEFTQACAEVPHIITAD